MSEAIKFLISIVLALAVMAGIAYMFVCHTAFTLSILIMIIILAALLFIFAALSVAIYNLLFDR